MLNHITIAGRLTKDPEIRRTQAGTPVASFTLACERDFKAQDGSKETDFLDCVAWRSKAEFIGKYFTKGRAVCVSGRLQIRNWEANDGTKRRSAEIEVEQVYFADAKASGPAGTEYELRQTPLGKPDEDYPVIDDDGELPF